MLNKVLVDNVMIKRVSLTFTVGVALILPLSNAAMAQDEDEQYMEEVVVQGIRASLTQASDLKRNADVIQDSIVAEDIGKFPDQNVAESLQRVTGVSISRVNGEGSQVSVRSFGPEFNLVKLNGRTLATTNGGRSFDFQMLPSELINGADIVKSPTASMDVGSIGASINVRTARPLDNPGFHVVGSVNFKQQDMAEEWNPEFAAVVSNTFADDSVGFLLGVSYRENHNRIDRYRSSHWGQYAADGSGYGLPLGENTLGEDGNPISLEGSRGPGRTIYSMVDENRERIGVNGVLQFGSDSFRSTIDTLYTRLDRKVLGSGLQLPNQTLSRYTRAVVSDEGTLLEATLENTDIEMNVDYGLAEETTEAIGYNGVFNADRLTLEVDASWSKASSDFEGDDTTALHFTSFAPDGSTQPSSFSVDYHADIPNLVVNSGLDLTDPSTVRAAWQRYARNKAEDEIKQLKLDARYEFDGAITSFEFGTAYEDRAISLDVWGTEFDAVTGGTTWNGSGMWIGDGSTWGTDASLGVLPASVLELSDSNFMPGIGGNFPRQWVQIADHQAYRAATQAYLEDRVANYPGDAWRDADGIVSNGWDTTYYGPGSSYANTSTTLSFYTQLNIETSLGDNTLSGNFGVRYITIGSTSKGTASTIDLLFLSETASLPDQPDNNALTSAKYSEITTTEDHWLPSINLALDFNNGNYLRTALAKTITRPSLVDSGANFSEAPGLDVASVFISGGNPYLKSYEVSQFDLSFEHYADNGNAYSIGFFYKDISNFISNITTVGPWDGPVDPELQAAYDNIGWSVSYTSNRKENRPGGTVQGLELGVLHNFDYLPGIWSGLGIQVNYTYADSEDDDARPINLPGVPEPSNSLEGFAEDSYNIVAFYDQNGVQVRLAYNWRDSFLLSRTGDGLQPQYTEDYGQWDFSFAYDITDSLTVSLEAVNLTNETRLEYLGQRDRVSLLEMSGTRYLVGLRATF
jgi:TonB-dependent receptor